MTEAADYLSDSELETMARAICEALGDDWTDAFDTREQQRVCKAPDGSFRDINAPSKDDYRDAARACHAARPATARELDSACMRRVGTGHPFLTSVAVDGYALERGRHLLAGEAKA